MSRCAPPLILVAMKPLITLLALPILSTALLSVAEAAPNVDLRVQLTAPAVHVYEMGTYRISVSNAGNRNATNVQLVIDLPRTHTSPQVLLMGNLGARDGRCAYASQRLTCNLSTIARGSSTAPITFDLRMPYSTAPLVITATATSSGQAPELTPADNAVSHTAQLALYPHAVSGGAANTRVCAGTGLTSFFECEQFPGSISDFDSVLEADHSITTDNGATTIGSWQVSGNYLHVEYYDGGGTYTANLASVGGDCFEGVFQFSGNYVGVHELCVQ